MILVHLQKAQTANRYLSCILELCLRSFFLIMKLRNREEELTLEVLIPASLPGWNTKEQTLIGLRIAFIIKYAGGWNWSGCSEVPHTVFTFCKKERKWGAGEEGEALWAEAGHPCSAWSHWSPAPAILCRSPLQGFQPRLPGKKRCLFFSSLYRAAEQCLHDFLNKECGSDLLIAYLLHLKFNRCQLWHINTFSPGDGLRQISFYAWHERHALFCAERPFFFFFKEKGKTILA